VEKANLNIRVGRAGELTFRERILWALSTNHRVTEQGKRQSKTQIVLDAVKDALLVAARKHYRTNENYIAELNEKTGSIDLFAVKKAVETVRIALEMTLQEAPPRRSGGRA